MAPEIRKYGIYEAPVYTSEIKLSGSFLTRDIAGLAEAETTYRWERAELRVPKRGLKPEPVLCRLRVADRVRREAILGEPVGRRTVQGG